MYNETWKRGYLAELSPTRVRSCELMFEILEPYEEDYQADVCTWSAKIAAPVLTEVVRGVRARSQLTRLILLRGYVRWMMASGYPGAVDDIIGIDTLGLEVVRKKSVPNPVKFHEYLNSVFDPEDENTIDNVYRCYYWLGYLGFKPENTLLVKCKDVDLERGILTFNDKQYPIYAEALKAFKYASQSGSFLFKHPRYAKFSSRDRLPGDTLIRGIKKGDNDTGYTTSVLNVELSRHHKAATENPKNGVVPEVAMSYYRAWLSGLFFRMYEKECRGFPVNFTEDAERYMEGKTYNFDTGWRTKDVKLKQITSDYAEDYRRWKVAWSIL